MTKILTASLAMEAEKKKDKGKGAHSKAGAPVAQTRVLAGLPDCNMAGSKGKFLRSPYLPAVRAASKILLLKPKQSSRSLRTSQLKSPRQDDMVFKVPKDEKRKVIFHAYVSWNTGKKPVVAYALLRNRVSVHKQSLVRFFLILQENQCSPKRKQQAHEKHNEGGSSSRKQRNVSSISKSRAQH